MIPTIYHNPPANLEQLPLGQPLAPQNSAILNSSFTSPFSEYQ